MGASAPRALRLESCIARHARHRDQPADHMQDIEEVSGVFRKPSLGLNGIKWRRWALIANERLGAVSATIAEPLPKHLPTRDLIGPHFRGDVFDIAISDLESS